MSFDPRRSSWNRRRAHVVAAEAAARNLRKTQDAHQGVNLSQDSVREQRRARAARELKLLGIKLVFGAVVALSLYFYIRHVAESLKPHPPAPPAASTGATP